MKSSKIFSIIFSVLLLTKSANSQNLSLISFSVCEIIKEFYTKYSRNVDIIDFGGSQGKLIGKIMENLNNSMTVTVRNTKEPKNWNQKLENQTILLFDKFQDLVDFNLNGLMMMKFINPIRFTIYCKNATKFDISKLKTDLVIPPYYYFIILDTKDMQLKLFTFENRDDLEDCHEIQKLIEINKFSATHHKWTEDPVFPKKYQNFYGCRMILGVFSSGMNFLRFFRAQTFNYINNPDGPLASIMEDIAERLNFSTFFFPCRFEMCHGVDNSRQYIYNVLHIATLDGYAFINMTEVQWRNVMLNIQCTSVFSLFLAFYNLILKCPHIRVLKFRCLHTSDLKFKCLHTKAL